MIGLSPLPAGHRRRFQPTCVRPSTGSYPRFSLPTGSSPGFASAAADCVALFGLALATARFPSLTSPAAGNSLAHSTKGTPSQPELLRRLGGARFQVLFHSPPGVLFTFPSRYWFAIGHGRVFRLGGWSPLLRTGFHVPGPTQGLVPYSIPGCAYGALTLCRRPSHAVRLSRIDVRGGRQTPGDQPCNPVGAKPAGRMRSTVWPWAPFARRYSGHLGVDFSSSGYLDVSVPPVVLPRPMCSAGGYASFLAWVRPFGDPRVEGCVLLAGDYRGLPRPSSASRAKASAVRPWYLPGPSGRTPCKRHTQTYSDIWCLGVAYRLEKAFQAVRCSSHEL